jgi:hypothetical protein
MMGFGFRVGIFNFEWPKPPEAENILGIRAKKVRI